METTDYRGSDVRFCTDGKYRWVYEMGMFTNPTIFWTVLKVLGGVWIAIWIVEVLVRGFEDFLPSLKMFAIVMAVIVVISFLGYLPFVEGRTLRSQVGTAGSLQSNEIGRLTE